MKLAMKSLVLFAVAFSSAAASEAGKDRTITQVVKLLQDMMEKSRKEGDEERVIYAKFKCYCDTQEAEKKASIAKLTKQIELLADQIAEIQGETGQLSSECADLKAKMAENEAAREEAAALRKKEKKAFLEEKADLEQAIEQMKEAIEVLSEVGADQTRSVGADNKQFMAGFGEKKASLLGLQSQVQTALKAAWALMSKPQQKASATFLQAPFTGTYTSQSAEVLGILKNMRDTFKANLAEAISTEDKAQKAHDKFMEIKEEAFETMSNQYDEKQKALGGNDETLATKKEQLNNAKDQKAEDEDFLDKLLPMCAEKATGYEKRKVMRANEEAAIAEAISILNSDAAFSTFGTVDATSSGRKVGAFVQLHDIRSHKLGDVHARHMLQNVLQKASKDAKSARLARVLVLVEAENPFATVLDEIKKMIGLIEEEGKADKKNLYWCKGERKENKANLKQKEQELVSLNQQIDELVDTIDNPETGLKVQIAQTEESLIEIKHAQTTQTAERTESNVAYQKDVKNLVSADAILTKAIKVLKKYYDDLAKKLAEADGAFVQKKRQPTPPDAWKGDGDFAGQSKQGTDVISQLEFILKQTQAEETDAHTEEEHAQATYEDSMQDLKHQEHENEKKIAELQESLAETEKELLTAREDHKATTKDKEAIEAYLEKIKPGCDFITANFETREKNRATERDALEKAVGLIKETPAYKTAENEAKVESYGKCKEQCVKDAAHVECKACMADVTIPAYCAGHEGTSGC